VAYSNKTLAQLRKENRRAAHIWYGGSRGLQSPRGPGEAVQSRTSPTAVSSQIAGGVAMAQTAQLEKEQLRLAAEARKRIANRIKELQPQAEAKVIAKAIGAHPRTIQRDVTTNVASVRKKSNRNNGYIPASATNVAEPPPVLSGAEVAKLAERAEAKAEAAQATQEKRAASRAAPVLPDGFEYRKGDCRVELSSNSVPLILTDPPLSV
jgi:hypothetical protein